MEKSYNFRHQGDVQVVMREVERELEAKAREFGLSVTRGAEALRLNRSGVDVVVRFQPDSVEVDLGLSGVLEVVRWQVERELQRRVPAILSRCKLPSGTNGRC